jgi:hypothetical protein
MLFIPRCIQGIGSAFITISGNYEEEEGIFVKNRYFLIISKGWQ